MPKSDYRSSPEVLSVFDSLRGFVGAAHVADGKWGQGDAYGKAWNLAKKVL
jgi:hypothetical protein